MKMVFYTSYMLGKRKLSLSIPLTILETKLSQTGQLFLTWKPFYTFDHLCCPSLDLCQGLPFCRACMNKLSTDLSTDPSRTSLVTSLHSPRALVFYLSITDITMLGSPLLYHSCFASLKAFGKGCIKILSKSIQITSTKPCYPCIC